MSGLSCDHAASRASLDTFIDSTLIIGVQAMTGEFALLGRCKACDSTLAIEIATPRGHAVAGEIGAVPSPVLTEITPAGRKAFREGFCETHKVAGECWGCDPAVNTIR